MASLKQGSFTIDLTSTKEVTIGDGHSNEIKIAITNKPDATQSRVRVTVNVNCRSTAEGLLDSTNAKVTATYANTTGNKTGNQSPLKSPPNLRTWQTTPQGVLVDPGKPLSLTFSEFESKTPPGDALVDILVQTHDGNGWTPEPEAVPETSRVLKVRKVAQEATKPKIHYFTVNPDYILHAGQTPVAVNFYATGFDSLVLFRNNQEVQNWPSNDQKKNDDGSITGSFSDTPTITTVYRLEGKSKAANEKTEKVLYRTVQVISPGWNQLALPQGYPVQLFVTTDFTPSDGKAASDRLYGIFVDGQGNAALYSSATGVDDWRPEPGDVPKDMVMSPGVAYHNKLWLIGGSCVDPASAGSAVWCYQKLDEDSNVRNWIKQDVTGDFPERMGHACVVSQGKLWVLGGYNSPNAFNDVWWLTDNEKGNVKWESVKRTCAWQGRVNPAAASFRSVDGDQEIWVYGGSAKPQSDGLNDLWSTQNGKDWSKLTDTIVPDPGTPLGSTLVIYPASVSSGSDETDRLFLIGSFLEWATGVAGKQGNRISSFLFEWHGLKEVWEERPVFNGWQQFRGENYYMQAVTFNGFLFVWSLQPGIDHTLKLNILVS